MITMIHIFLSLLVLFVLKQTRSNAIKQLFFQKYYVPNGYAVFLSHNMTQCQCKNAQYEDCVSGLMLSCIIHSLSPAISV